MLAARRYRTGAHLRPRDRRPAHRCANEMPRQPTCRKARAVGKAEHRPKAIGRCCSDEVEAGDRRLEMARQARRTIGTEKRCLQIGIQKIEATSVYLEAGGGDHMICPHGAGCRSVLPQCELYASV